LAKGDGKDYLRQVRDEVRNEIYKTEKEDIWGYLLKIKEGIERLEAAIKEAKTFVVPSSFENWMYTKLRAGQLGALKQLAEEYESEGR
jgi:hypothetical protein